MAIFRTFLLIQGLLIAEQGRMAMEVDNIHPSYDIISPGGRGATTLRSPQCSNLPGAEPTPRHHLTARHYYLSLSGQEPSTVVGLG